MRFRQTATLIAVTAACGFAKADENNCVECHTKTTPGIVTDWKASLHSTSDVTCDICHGDKHKTADDVAQAKIPTPETCAECHEEQVEQFKSGKHALAWAAMKAMPTTHWHPSELMEGMKGCGGCHKIGLKTATEIEQLKAEGAGFGVASCDACHTRHLFSTLEAKQPQACRTCHMGFDHPQWEMYSASKHGVRHDLKQRGLLPDSVSAPTCQTCHMPDGHHGVQTAWGFLGVRLPMPEDKQWAEDRATLLKALGVLDPDGNPTPRLEVVKAAKVARLTQEGWQKQRDAMIKVCGDCHSENFARAELEKGDQMIRRADRLMAQAIEIVAELYKEGVIRKPPSYKHPYPDLLTFHDAPTEVEQTLFVMYLKHRMRTFQGAFHNNPDYTLWYGWSEMQRDLTRIRDLSETLRARHVHGK